MMFCLYGNTSVRLFFFYINERGFMLIGYLYIRTFLIFNGRWFVKALNFLWYVFIFKVDL